MNTASSRHDLVVVGSGFAGTLLSLVARRLDLSVALLERGRHPRFALGESTTPLANLVLADLARRYRLPRVFQRASYGHWLRAEPALPVGLKRGFTFLAHRPGEPYRPGRRLLVEASDRDEVADTQWMRADLDAFLVGEACEAGVSFRDEVDVELLSLDPPRVRVAPRAGGESAELEARLLVDASGEAGFLPRALGLGVERSSPPWRQARTVYTHVRETRRLRPILAGAGEDVEALPYEPDDAAVHHVFPGGWMWSLRFTDGRVSAGFVLDADRYPRLEGSSSDDEWRRLLRRFPTLERLYGEAPRVEPVREHAALGRRVETASGPTWALLPHTAYFVDPLLSAGIAHALVSIERLAEILSRGLGGSALGDDLLAYGRDLLEEARGVESLVAGCRSAFERFEHFEPFVMHYFVAASSLEGARRAGRPDPAGFLRLRDPAFRRVLELARADLSRALSGDAPDASAACLAGAAARLARWNVEGFCDPAAGGSYRSPRRPEEVWS